jgi:hypothetical protein
MPAIVDRETGSVLMLVEDPDEAEIITFALRRRGVDANVRPYIERGPRTRSVRDRDGLRGVTRRSA